MLFLHWLTYLGDTVWLLIAHISGRSSFPKPLKSGEEKKLIQQMASGDSCAEKLLIEHNLRLVAHIAKKYVNSGVDQDDLVSIGSIGLIKAVGSFRPDAGKLTAYASRCIENEILMFLRSNKKTRGNLSLNEPIDSDRDGNEIMLIDILGTEGDMVYQEVETKIESSRAIRLMNECLTARERRVIQLRYGLSDGIYHPQHEVARVLSISRSYVSRIEKKAIEKLFDALNQKQDG